MMLELNKSWIRMKDPDLVRKKLSEMIVDGPDRLQVIADFDMTLTRYHMNGTVCNTCHGMLTATPVMELSYRKQLMALRDKYYPVELDPRVSEDAKIPLMIEWYTSSHNLLLKHGLNKNDIRHMVSLRHILLRDRADNLLKYLNEESVPLLIFSAGIGDIILEVIEQQANIYPNIKVISNFMEFDDSGQLIGFKGNLIHMFKKNEAALKESDPEYFCKLNKRTNILLVGDSVGDLDMARGAPSSANILKIGFLNTRIEERLDQFLDGFDVVLVDDQSVDVIEEIIRNIISP